MLHGQLIHNYKSLTLKNKIMIKNIKWLLLASITFVACSKDVEEAVTPTPEVPLTKGSADFTKYVALGNSLTAGFSDNALFKAGQDGSYTNLMAKQFATVGGGAFKIPYMNDNRGGLLFGGAPFALDPSQFAPRLTIDGIINNSPNITLASPVGSQTTETLANIFAQGPYNNMGVPGAKSFHLLAPGYGSAANLNVGRANPYFVRFASSATTSVLADAMAQTPTFFSLWIGNNDVLGYALAGGVPTSQDPVKGGDITPSAGAPGVGFDASYTALVTTLTSGGAKGVIANIPYVTTIPQFTTVPYNPLTPQLLGAGDAAVGVATIKSLNTSLYEPLKNAFTAFGAADRIKLLSETGNNPLLIKDESLPNLSAQLTAAFTPTLGAATAGAFGAIYGQARQATQKDLFLLGTQRVIGSTNPMAPASINKFGITFPLQDKDVLIPAEIAELKTATDAFNATIKSLADAKGLAFVDANALLTKVASGGVRFGQYQLSSSYVVGGAFSLDGVHPAPQGYALIANEFMKAINSKYGSTLRMYDLTNFPIQYPKVLPN
jgi:hypothetical protein